MATGGVLDTKKSQFQAGESIVLVPISTPVDLF